MDTVVDPDSSLILVECYPSMKEPDPKKHKQLKYLKKSFHVLGWDIKRYTRKEIGYTESSFWKFVISTFTARNDSLISTLELTKNTKKIRVVIAGQAHLKEYLTDNRVSVEPLRQYLRDKKAVILLQKLSYDNLNTYLERVEEKCPGFIQTEMKFWAAILVAVSIAIICFTVSGVTFFKLNAALWKMDLALLIIGGCSLPLPIFIFKKWINWHKNVAARVSAQPPP